MKTGFAIFGAVCLLVLALFVAATWPLVPVIFYALFFGGLK